MKYVQSAFNLLNCIIVQFRYIKILTCFRGLREQNKRSKIFIPEPRCDFICFIPQSLGGKYKFYYIEIGLFVQHVPTNQNKIRCFVNQSGKKPKPYSHSLQLRMGSRFFPIHNQLRVFFPHLALIAGLPIHSRFVHA